jgi:hypothetical protein
MKTVLAVELAACGAGGVLIKWAVGMVKLYQDCQDKQGDW